MISKIALRSALLAGVSIAIASPAYADANLPDGTTVNPSIVIRDDIDPTQPAPAGDLDSGVTGVGQIVTDQGGGFVGLCTGTLINPRTVIFASHCVNELPADAYGASSGGVGISVGFSADNLPAILSWLIGRGGPVFGTNTALNIYNVEQVWYDPRALDNPDARGFLEADVALGTLDTPAFGVPTWALLFSPLTQEEHVSIVGYGGAGNGTGGDTLGIDFRRRAAENMVSMLGSLDDEDALLFGIPPEGLPQNVYMTDFDDPNFGTVNANSFDFNIFGGGPALPREGVTAGGDSGGPLIVDEKYDRPVVAGVLSGGSRFFEAQPGSSYGTTSIYQPLYLFWDAIVANNPYVYANNKAGNADWTDPSHWVQAMDPNYMIDQSGQLVNSLPDTPALGVSGEGVKFGQFCFFEDCSDPLTGTAPTGNGTPVFVQGGPGSTNFVPNNVVAKPKAGVRSHYYDVTLAAEGTTSLSSKATIDRLTLNGPTKLDITSKGKLEVLGDLTQLQGWTNVDGQLKSGETLVVSGILSGSGMIDPTYLTVIGGMVAPGSTSAPATLSVKGDVILSSASLLAIDVSHTASDLLKVMADASNPGELALDGGSILFGAVSGGPRDGDSFKIVSATGGVDGTFGTVGSVGILNATLTYGPNDVRAKFQAGSFANYLGSSNPTVMAFANALDTLRGGSYNSLYGLYGMVDLMSPQAVAATFQGLAPRIDNESRNLQERQSKTMLNAVSDRLSMLGTGTGGTLTVSGNPSALALNGIQSQRNGFANLAPGTTASVLPKGMSGFVTGGSTSSRATYGGFGEEQGQRSDYMAIGMEHQFSPRLTIGAATGYANGISIPGTDRARVKTSQAALYGSYRLGGGAYVGGMASAETSSVSLSRTAMTGNSAFDLTGATHSERYTATAEAGVNLGLAKGLTLTPRAQLGYSSYKLDGFRENGGEVALQMDGLKLQKLEARLGAKLAGSMAIGGGWSFTPQIQADYVHLLSGADHGLAVRFANAPDYRFLLPLANGGSYAEVRGGFRVSKGALDFGAGVQANVGNSLLQDNRAIADVSVHF
jgi:outer membrane autotransporter protein